MSPIQTTRMSNYRWIVCGMLFLATVITYLDRQVLSLTWRDYIAPVFAWTDADYGMITATFSIAYGFSMLFSGRLMDAVGVKNGYAWAMGLWCLGAMLHAFCGIITTGVLTGTWILSFDGAIEILHDYSFAGLTLTTVSINAFMICRLILAIAQSGNFPASNITTTTYFPQKDRAFATAIYNNGASVGALVAPVLIPIIANRFGWEMAFIIVGAIGYIWIFFWLVIYVRPKRNKYMTSAEYTYIKQDSVHVVDTKTKKKEEKIGWFACFTYRQTWALIIAKLLTDGVWWFILFWTPLYIADIYSLSFDSPMSVALIMVVYIVSMLSVLGGYLPTYFVNKYGMSPYQGHVRSMFYCALTPLIGVFAVPLGNLTPWLFVLVVGMMGAAHQGWSANVYSMVGDFFPKSSVGTVTGIIGFAGGLGSYIIMMLVGWLFFLVTSEGENFMLLGYSGRHAAYMIMFCTCSVVYLITWFVMKTILPVRTVNEKV